MVHRRVHPRSVRFGALCGLVGSLLAVLLATLPAHAAAPPFLAANGTLTLEAEHADAIQARSGTAWRTIASGSAANGQALDATGDGYRSPGDGATATYDMVTNRSGVYFLWVRARADTSSANSVNVGADGQFDRLHLATSGEWAWHNQQTGNAGRASQYLGAGTHTLQLAVSEAGAQIDRVVLTTDASYQPSGVGPDESTRQGQEPINPIRPPPAPTRPVRPAPPAPPLATGDHPMGCARDELFLDAQDWWTNPDGGSGQDFGHLHTQLCFPWQQTLRGTVNLTVHSLLHSNPGTFRQLQVQLYQGDSANIVAYNRTFDRTLKTCQQTGGELRDGGMTCRWTDSVSVDTRRARYDGEVQFRVRGFVREPDGTEMRTSTSLHATLSNGGRARYDRLYADMDGTEGRGWYSGVNYARAALDDATRLVRPVSGVWTPRVRLGRGSDGRAGDGWYAAIDTDFHQNNPGQALCPGGVRTQRGHPVCDGGEFGGTLRIDTTKLSNGWHRLFLKADQRADNGSIHSGVMSTYFLVQN